MTSRLPILRASHQGVIRSTARGLEACLRYLDRLDDDAKAIADAPVVKAELVALEARLRLAALGF